MAKVEVVVAHDERATLRVGDVFVKIDGDPDRLEREVAAMALAPVPTPGVVWRQRQALALAALPGTPLGHLGDPSTASAAAWVATGRAVRALHDAPLPPWPGRHPDELATRLDVECAWLLAHDVIPPHAVVRNRRRADLVLDVWEPAFIHGDLQVDHVFIRGDDVTGILDWSEAAPGDRHVDLATLTLGHPEHLDDVLTGYGPGVDRDRIRSWWSMRCLLNVRWLSEHGFGPIEEMPEVAVLLSPE